VQWCRFEFSKALRPGEKNMAGKALYKVIFFNHGKVYELFCESVGSSGLWGFIEVAELVFATGEGLVVDPTEEKMRQEFEGAKVLHLPIQSVVRIEEVEKRGKCLIRDRESGEKVTPFPLSPPNRSQS
jgi:hypothetical protein